MKKLALFPILFVAACETATLPPADVVPPVGEDSCGAAEHAALIGQNATALERVLIMRPVRVIRPGMAITMDYSQDRINFDIGEDGNIRRIWCG